MSESVGKDLAANEDFPCLAHRIYEMGSTPLSYGRYIDEVGSVTAGVKNNVNANVGTVCTMDLRVCTQNKNTVGVYDKLQAFIDIRYMLGGKKAAIDRGASRLAYDSLAAAVAAVQNGETVLVGADTDANITLSKVGTFTIDPYGFNWTGNAVAGDGFFFKSQAEVDSLAVAQGVTSAQAITYVVAQKVASVGETFYDNLAEAVANANGAVVTLLAATDETITLTAEGQSFTLNKNGIAFDDAKVVTSIDGSSVNVATAGGVTNYSLVKDVVTSGEAHYPSIEAAIAAAEGSTVAVTVIAADAETIALDAGKTLSVTVADGVTANVTVNPAEGAFIDTTTSGSTTTYESKKITVEMSEPQTAVAVSKIENGATNEVSDAATISTAVAQLMGNGDVPRTDNTDKLDVLNKITVTPTKIVEEVVGDKTIIRSATFDVVPALNAGQSLGEGQKLKFRLPVDAAATQSKAFVYHGDARFGVYTVQSENEEKFIEVESGEFSPYGYELLDAISYNDFVAALVVGNGTFDGQAAAYDSLQKDAKGRLLVVWSPKSGCRAVGTSNHQYAGCDHVTEATYETPNRVNGGCAQYQITSSMVAGDISISNVSFIYDNVGDQADGSFWYDANGWNGTGASGLPGELQLENHGNIAIDNCSFDGVCLTPYHEGSSTTYGLTVTDSDFLNNTKSGLRGINSKTVTVSGCTFTDCDKGVDFVSNTNRSDSDITLTDNVFDNVKTPFKLRTITQKVNVTGDDTVVRNSPSGATLFSYDTANVDVSQYLSISGGTYDIDVTGYTATNYTANDNSNGTWTVNEIRVAKIGTTYYPTLTASVAAAQSGDTIVVIADISDEAVEVPASVTIKSDDATNPRTLSNVSINATGSDISLTVKDLAFTGNSWINSANGGELTVENVTADVSPSNGTAVNSRSTFIGLGRNESKTLALTVKDSTIVVPSGTDAILGWSKITEASIEGTTIGSASKKINSGDAVKIMGVASGATISFVGNTVYSDWNGIAIEPNTSRDNDYVAIFEKNTFVGNADHIWFDAQGSTVSHATVLATSDNTVNGVALTPANIANNDTTWTSYAGVDIVTDESGKITAGTFTSYSSASAIEAALAEGYVSETDANGWYHVDVKPVAQIGTTKYGTFAEAIAAAEEYKTENGDYPVITVLDATAEQTNPDWKIADGKLVHKLYVAQIGTAKYESLAEAVAAASAGDTITMLADDNVSLTGGARLTIDKSLTITGPVDANGEPLYTIYGTPAQTGTNNIYVDGDGTVTLSNLKIDGFGNNKGTDGSHAPVYVASSFTGTVNLDNLHVSDFNRGGVFLYGGTFNVTDCYIDCANNRSGAFTKGIEIKGTATGTIKDTVIVNMERSSTTYSTAGIEVYGNGTIVVDGCSIISDVDPHQSVKGTYGIVSSRVGDHDPSGGSLHVTDCYIDVSNAALSVADDDEYGPVNNYSIVVDGEDTYFGNYIATWSAGSSITINEGEFSEDVYADAGTITITGGTFNNFLPDVDTGTIAISGGIFDKAVPEEYCAEGFIPATYDAASGLYTVKQGAFVAAVYDDSFDLVSKHETLYDAVRAAQDGYTVELLADVEESVTIYKSIALAGDYTITGVTKVDAGATVTMEDVTLDGNGMIYALDIAGGATVGMHATTVGGGVWCNVHVNGATFLGEGVAMQGDEIVVAADGQTFTYKGETLDAAEAPWGLDVTKIPGETLKVPFMDVVRENGDDTITLQDMDGKPLVQSGSILYVANMPGDTMLTGVTLPARFGSYSLTIDADIAFLGDADTPTTGWTIGDWNEVIDTGSTVLDAIGEDSDDVPVELTLNGDADLGDNVFEFRYPNLTIDGDDHAVSGTIKYTDDAGVVENIVLGTDEKPLTLDMTEVSDTIHLGNGVDVANVVVQLTDEQATAGTPVFTWTPSEGGTPDHEDVVIQVSGSASDSALVWDDELGVAYIGPCEARLTGPTHETPVYASLADALLRAASEGDTITLLMDITDFTGMQAIGKSLTLDGAGHKVVAAAGAAGEEMFDVAGDVDVTIKDITVDGAHKYTYCIQAFGDDANLTLENVTVLHGTKEWFSGFKYGAGVHVNGANLFIKGNFTAFSGGKADESFPFTGILYEGGAVLFADGATASIANPENLADTDLLLVGMLGALDVSDPSDRADVEAMLDDMNVPAGFYPYTLKINPDEWNGSFEQNTSFTGASPLGWNAIIDYGKAIMEAISMDTAETPVEVGLLTDTALPDTFTFEDSNFTVNGNGYALSGEITYTDNAGTVENIVLGTDEAPLSLDMTGVTKLPVTLGGDVDVENVVIKLTQPQTEAGTPVFVWDTEETAPVHEQVAIQVPGSAGTDAELIWDDEIGLAYIGPCEARLTGPTHAMPLYTTLAAAVAAAQAGDTITLLTNVANAGEIAMTAGATFAGAGHVLSGDSTITLHPAGGTVKGVTFDDIRPARGEIPSVSTASNPDAGAAFEVAGCTFTAPGAVAHVLITAETTTDFSATVTGNVFNAGTKTTRAFAVVNAADAAKLTLTGNYVANGLYYGASVDGANVGEIVYPMLATADATEATVTLPTFIVKSTPDGKPSIAGYDTLAAAVEGAITGSQIILTADASFDVPVVAVSKSLTIDGAFGGSVHTLSATGSWALKGVQEPNKPTTAFGSFTLQNMTLACGAGDYSAARFEKVTVGDDIAIDATAATGFSLKAESVADGTTLVVTQANLAYGQKLLGATATTPSLLDAVTVTGIDADTYLALSGDNFLVVSQYVARIGDTPYVTLADAIAAADEALETTGVDPTITLIGTGHVAPANWVVVGNTLVRAVAKIGDDYFATLADAYDAAQDGDTITVLRDITLAAKQDIAKSITLDLGGKTITLGECEDGYAIGIASGDVSVTGAGAIAAATGKYALYVAGGTATISNGTFAAIGVEGGTVSVIDGTFNNGILVAAGSAAIEGGLFTAGEIGTEGEGTLAISGGYFYAPVPEAFCAAGYIPSPDTTEIDSVTYYTVKLGRYVAQVVHTDGDTTTTTKFETLADAFDAAQNGDAVELLTDIDFTGSQDVTGKNIVFDGRGHTVKAVGDSVGHQMFKVLSDTVTFQNLTVDVDHKYWFGIETVNSANLVLSDVTVLRGGDTNLNYGAAVHANGASLVVKNAFTAKSGGKTAGCFPFTGIIYEWESGGGIHFDDGVTADIGDDLLLIGMLGAPFDASTPEGKAEVATVLAAMNVPSEYKPYTLQLDSEAGVLNGNNTFTGASKLGWNDIIDYGKAIMEFVEISTTETPVEVGLLADTTIPGTFTFEDANFTINGNGYELEGTIKYKPTAGVISNVTLGAGATLDITDVTHASDIKFGEGVVVDQAKIVGDAILNQIVAEGDGIGGISVDNFDLTGLTIPEGSMLAKVDDGNGNLVLQVVTAVAKIGSTVYPSLQSAANAAQDGDTITMLVDEALASTATFPANKKIVLDLNGKTISHSSGTPTIMVPANASLTVDDTFDGADGCIKNTAANGVAIYCDAGSVTIDNGTIGSLDTYRGIVVDHVGTVVVNDGSVIASNAAIRSTSTAHDVITINGGTIGDPTTDYAIYDYDYATIAIHGGVLNADKIAIAAFGSTLTIDGGEINKYGNTEYAILLGEAGTATISAGTITSAYTGIYVGDNGTTLNITGGTITAAGEATILTNGTRNEAAIINISGGTVANTGTGSAIYQPNRGTTVNISGDAVVTGPTGVILKGGTLNVSGGTISGTGTYTAPAAMSSGGTSTGDAVYVEDTYSENGNYKPTVNVTGGTLTSANGYAAQYYTQATAVTENQANGSINISGDAVLYSTKQRDAMASTEIPNKVVISGGFFAHEVPEEYCAENYVPQEQVAKTIGGVDYYTVKTGYYVAQVTFAEGDTVVTNKFETETSEGGITVGQALLNATAAADALYDAGTNSVITIISVPEGTLPPTGWAFVTEGGVTTLQRAVAQVVTIVGETVTTNKQFATIQDAIDAVGENGFGRTVEVLRNVALDDGLTIEKSLVLTGAVDAEGKPAYTITGLKDKTANAGYADVYVSDDGAAVTVTISNLKLRDFGNAAAQDGSSAVTFDAYEADSTLTLVNLDVASYNQYAVATLGDGTLAVQDCTIDGAAADATRDMGGVYAKNGAASISGGEIKNVAVGIDADDASVTIANVTVTANADGTAIGASAGATVTVNGGDYAGALDVDDYSDLEVASGHFDRYVDETYCADGKIALPWSGKEGWYEVVEGHFVAAVLHDDGNGVVVTTPYASLTAAVEAAASGDTVMMLADDRSLADGSELLIAKSITITGPVDENGEPLYTIYGKNDSNGYNDIFIRGGAGDTVTISNVNVAQFGNQASLVMDRAPIYVGGGNQGKVVLDNVRITEFLRIGVVMSGSGEFEIRNCYIDGARARTDTCSYGIEVHRAAHGVIADTTIENVSSTSDGWGAACVTVNGQGAVSVTNCTFVGGISCDGIGTSENATEGACTSVVTLEDCTIDADCAIGVNVDGVQFVVKSGRYKGGLGLGDGVENAAPYAVSGGLFDAPVPEAFCAAGYIPRKGVVETVDGVDYYTVKLGAYVARNTTTGQGYETLEEALAEVTAAQNVKLLDDVTLADDVMLAPTGDIGLTLDGKTLAANGHTIAIPVGLEVIVDEQLADLFVAPAKYVIGESEDEGTYVYTPVKVVAMIEDTPYTNFVDAVTAYQDGDTIVVVDYEDTMVAPEDWKFVTDDTVDPAVTTLVHLDYVARIESTGETYTSLAKAIAAVPTDGTATTITMIANSAETTMSTVQAGKNIVLELNGKTVSATASGTNWHLIENAGTLTIQDSVGGGLITADGTCGGELSVVYNCGGTLNLVSGTISYTGNYYMAYAVCNSSNAWGSDIVSTFNMTGGTLSCPTGDQALRVYQNCSANSTALSKNYVNISGGTILDTGIFVDTNLHTANGSTAGFADSIDTQINISGGTINGLVDLKIRHKNNTKLTITGGDFTNAKLWVRKADGYAYEEPAEPMVYVSGGNFDFVSGKSFGLSYDCGATSWTTYEKPYAVSGGWFSEQVPVMACAEGFEPTGALADAPSAAMPYTVAFTADIVYPIEGTSGVPIALAWATNNTSVVSEGAPVTAADVPGIIEALGQDGANGMPKWESYVLGLNPVDANARLRLTASPKSATTVEIKCLIDTTKFPTIVGTTVTYRLAELNADGTWTKVAESNGPSFIQSLEDVVGKVLYIFADIVTE
ncbi:MAG: hypothetical protein IJI36_08370 [Kiritimatiellae bacterium]|nr:hypothetical protein [Kiritimatiellia bacterium]